MKRDTCSEYQLREEALRPVRDTLPPAQELGELAELFKLFGDGTRIRILFCLFAAEVCVCELAELLGMTQSAVSHQLRILKQGRLVRARREGKSVYYALADDHVRRIVAQGMEHLREG